MSTVTFHPARLQGSADVPPAKSEAHRALLLAALGGSPCRLKGFAPPLCDDTLAMMAGVRALGATVTEEDGDLLIIPAEPPQPDAPMVECHVNACAAALRMLIPAFLIRGQGVRFTMTEGLYHRPHDAYDPLIKKIGGQMERVPGGNGRPYVIQVTGRMPAGEYQIDGSKSSQFASGLLIALAHSRNAQNRPAQAFLNVTGDIVSRPYLDMTLSLMKRFGLNCSELGEGAFTLSPRMAASPESVAVCGDWSQAAVFLCANAMGNGVMVRNLLEGECLQGDARVMEVLTRMGMRMLRSRRELYAVCPSHAELSPVDVDCSDIPDIAPILALALSRVKGRSVLRGVHRLTIKECDRLKATADFLNRLGAKAEVDAAGDVLTVTGCQTLHGGFTADAQGDHRMVMLLAAAATVADKPITVVGAEALNKSWPGFLETWRALGGIMS